MFLSTVIFLFHCGGKDSTKPQKRDAGIYGKVTNKDGNPISDVAIHFVYDNLSKANLAKINNTQFIVLEDFQAYMINDTVFISWSTLSESNNAGFHIFRGDSEFGEFIQITDTLIPSQGNSSESQQYSYIDESASDQENWYKLLAVDTQGDSEFFGPVLPPSSIEDTSDTIPINFQLDQNYPNPFDLSTSIVLTLPQQETVTLAVYDVNDIIKVVLVDKPLAAGMHLIFWDGMAENSLHVPNGIYECRMQAGTFNSKVEMCINNMDPAHLRNYNPKTNSNNDGVFNITTDDLCLDKTISLTDETGNDIGESIISEISLVCIKEGYIPVSKKVQLQANQAIDVTIILEKPTL